MSRSGIFLQMLNEISPGSAELLLAECAVREAEKALGISRQDAINGMNVDRCNRDLDALIAAKRQLDAAQAVYDAARAAEK